MKVYQKPDVCRLSCDFVDIFLESNVADNLTGWKWEDSDVGIQ